MKSVLHVESDISLQKSLKAYLEKNNGISVTSIISAYEALDLLKNHRFDIIISEYNLPVTDGQTFLEIIRRSRSDQTPFIFFAQKADRHIVLNALNAGATFFVLKGGYPEKEFSVLEHFIHQAIRQKQLEDALKDRERQYRSVVEDQSEFIIRFLPDGTLLFVNEAYCTYFNTSRKAILGRNVRDIIPHMEQDNYFSQLRHLTPDNPVNCIDSRRVLPDKSVLWQQWNNRAIFNDNAEIAEYQAVGRDISAQKNAESALIQAHKNLGVMNTITRHDILNQLTAVFSYLDLARTLNTNENVDACLDKASRATETIRGQILFTKDYQDIGSDAAQWQNLETLVNRAVKGLDLSGIDFICTLPDVWIFADPLVEKVFYNLVENTLRHGGDVTVIRISYREDESGFVIIFEDDGIGIPSDAKEKIFRREYYQNTGLGLYLIREILAITKISIIECGTYSCGARFEMTVPEGNYGFRKE